MANLRFNKYKYKRSGFDQNDGTIFDIQISNNVGIPVVSWVGPNNYTAGPFNGVSSQDLTNLAPGTYTGTVTDDTGSVTTEITIDEKNELILTTSANGDSDDCINSIQILNFQGNGFPFLYSLVDESDNSIIASYSGDSNDSKQYTFNGLCPGSYNVIAIELEEITYNYSFSEGCVTEDVTYDNTTDPVSILANWDRFGIFSYCYLSGGDDGLLPDGSVQTDNPNTFFYTGSTRYRGEHALVTEEGLQPTQPLPFSASMGSFYYDTNINKFLVYGNCGVGNVWDTFAAREDYGNAGSPRSNTIGTDSNNWTTSNVTNDFYTLNSNGNVVPARDKILGENGFPTAITGLLNSPQRAGFISDCKFNNYVHEFTIGANDNDDDIIGTVLATFRDDNNVYGDDGYSYTLVFNFWNEFLSPDRVKPQVSVLYNLDEGRGFELANGSKTNYIIKRNSDATSPFSIGGYRSQGYVRVRVTRSGEDGELFKIQMTETMGSETLHPNATKNVNESNPFVAAYEINFSLTDKTTWEYVRNDTGVSGNELNKFLGSQKYGYYNQSQAQTRFFDINFSGFRDNIFTEFSDSTYATSSSFTLGTEGCGCADINDNSITNFMVTSDGIIKGFIDNSQVTLSTECCERLNGVWDQNTNSCILDRSYSNTQTKFCDTLLDYKIIMNPQENHGTLFDVDENESCTLTLGFDYLLEWNCEDLLACISENNTTLRTVLEGATLTATLEKFNTNSSSLETVTEIPVLEVDDFFTYIEGSTGWLLTGDELSCNIINNELFSELNNDCDILAGNKILDSNWNKFSINISDLTILNKIKNESISLGLKVKSEFCEFSLLIDNVKLTQDCVKVVTTNKYINKNPGFDLIKTVDNKKSWVRTEEQENRTYDLEYRNTCYDVNSGRLVVNSKELDIESSISRAIEEGVASLVSEESCLLKVNESFTRNTNIYAVFDTTSMLVNDGLAASDALNTWFNDFKLENPNYKGNLYSIGTNSEQYVSYATKLANGTLHLGGTGGAWSSLNTMPSNFTGDTEAILLAFIDETNTEYHASRLDVGYSESYYNIIPKNGLTVDVPFNKFTNLPQNNIEIIGAVSRSGYSYVQYVTKIGSNTLLFNTLRNGGYFYPNNTNTYNVTALDVTAQEIGNPANRQTVAVNVNIYPALQDSGRQQPTPNYVNTYKEFVNIYNTFNFFRGIVYPIIRGGSNGVGAALVLQAMSAIEGKTLTQNQLNRIDYYPPLDLTPITINNPYENYDLGNGVFMKPLKDFGWEGVYNKVSPAQDVFSGTVFKEDLNRFLLGGYNLDDLNINEIFDTNIYPCNYNKVDLLRKKLIDVKSRKIMSAYPVLRLVYDRYLDFANLCGLPIDALTYDKVIKFNKLLGSQWVELIEQVVPSTALWKSTNIYSNTLFDSNKFIYRNYSMETCDMPEGNGVYTYEFVEGNVEVFDVSADSTKINGDCSITINSTICDTVYAHSLNDGSIFKGKINNNENVINVV